MIKKCLFPAAGYGTRFLPATKAVPKEMLPILTKPLLQYGVDKALSFFTPAFFQYERFTLTNWNIVLV